MSKKDEDDAVIYVPNKILAEALDTSPYHVIKMRQEGLVPKGVGRGKFPLIESCRMVVRRLREERKTASSIEGTSAPKEQVVACLRDELGREDPVIVARMIWDLLSR